MISRLAYQGPAYHFVQITGSPERLEHADLQRLASCRFVIGGDPTVSGLPVFTQPAVYSPYPVSLLLIAHIAHKAIMLIRAQYHCCTASTLKKPQLFAMQFLYLKPYHTEK